MSRSPRPERPRTAVAEFPRPQRFVPVLPTRRSLVVGIALAALTIVAYAVARETPIFAVRTIEVQGAPPALARRVASALRPVEGRSLVVLDGAQVDALASALPGVAAVSYDRAFPNTLRVQVEPEQPLAVVRHGVDAWLVSRRGRVMARVAQGTHRALPRIWLRKDVPVRLGRMLGAGGGTEEIAALRPVTAVPLVPRVASVRVQKGQVVYVLRGGLDVRAGRATDLPLKLEIARQILDQTAVHGYLDVSVVERPVAGLDPQVSG